MSYLHLADSHPVILASLTKARPFDAPMLLLDCTTYFPRNLLLRMAQKYLLITEIIPYLAYHIGQQGPLCHGRMLNRHLFNTTIVR